MLNKVSLRNFDMVWISLGELKKVVIRLIEIIAILSIGLLFTVYILKPIYEKYGILFIGNVWVNWLEFLIFYLSYTR